MDTTIEILIGTIGILLIVMLGLVVDANTNRVILPDGSVNYNHPVNDYQKAVDELNDLVPVYEQEIADNEIGDVQGQTWFINGQPIKVLIEEPDPAIVYHEMYHVLDPAATEQQCDQYATLRGFPIHDATY